MRARFLTPAVVAAGLFLLAVAMPSASADTKGWYRIVTLDKKVHEGEVIEERPDAYVIKDRRGPTVTIPKKQIREMTPLADPAPAASAGAVSAGAAPAGGKSAAGAGPERLNVTDAEIQQILGDEPVDVDEDEELGADVTQELPVNEDSVRQMEAIAGANCKRLIKPHFVFVYTSDKESANELAARLESVYRWNWKFMEMMGLKPRHPEYKLEIFFFGTHEEYQGYQANQGFVSEGALGFYMRTNNRSAFFDMQTWPTIANLKEQLKQADGETRRYIGNRVARWTEHMNLEVVQHEAAHHVHFNIGLFPARGQLPRWMTEGLATMFEVPPGKSGASLGATNHYRLYQFRQIYGKKGERLPDLRLFIVDDRLWSGGNSYPLGWALNHYLYRRYRDKYSLWIQRLSAREEDVQVSETDRQKEFEDIFGPVDEKWTKNFISYIADIELKMSEIPE
jgi:hypothetical protein